MSNDLLHPTNVRRLWNNATPAADRADALRDRDRHLARIAGAHRTGEESEALVARVRRQIDAGDYPDDDHKLDASLEPLLAEINRRPAEAVDPDDAVEHYDRFEGSL